MFSTVIFMGSKLLSAKKSLYIFTLFIKLNLIVLNWKMIKKEHFELIGRD